MEPERWKHIQALYDSAIALPAEKRAEFLAQACPADAGLRSEVQSLLAQQAGSFLESGPVSTIKTLGAGAKLGNFEIVELIGRGGMGEVFRARDSRLRRDVATVGPLSTHLRFSARTRRAVAEAPPWRRGGAGRARRDRHQTGLARRLRWRQW
jgi:hypothetical protein